MSTLEHYSQYILSLSFYLRISRLISNYVITTVSGSLHKFVHQYENFAYVKIIYFHRYNTRERVLYELIKRILYFVKHPEKNLQTY